MVRWGILLIGLCLLSGTGCGSDQSSGDASQETSTSADTAEVASTSAASNETDSEMESTHEETSSAENEGEEMSAGSSEESSSSAPALTETQKNRIGGRLQRVIRGEKEGPRPVEPVGSRDGVPVYEVIIKTDDPDALREAGIPLGSVQGSIATARLTVNQILKAATVKGVGGIQAATRQETHEERPGEDVEVQPMDKEDSSG